MFISLETLPKQFLNASTTSFVDESRHNLFSTFQDKKKSFSAKSGLRGD